jgi:hypothetical protein
MSIDLHSITTRQVEEARAEVARLDAVWRPYQFVDIPHEALLAQEQTIHNLAARLDEQQRDLMMGLMKQAERICLSRLVAVSDAPVPPRQWVKNLWTSSANSCGARQ